MQPHCTSPHGLARQRCWTSNTASVQDSESELQAQTQFNVLTCFGWGPHPQSLFCHCTLPRKAFTRKRRSCGPLERNVQVRKSFSRLSRGSRGTVFFLACELQGSRVCFLIFHSLCPGLSKSAHSRHRFGCWLKRSRHQWETRDGAHMMMP